MSEVSCVLTHTLWHSAERELRACVLSGLERALALGFWDSAEILPGILP